MPRERVTMRKTREILRLVWSCGQSRRDTARTCGVGKSTVDATINRATAAGLSWPLPFDLDDEALERRLYPPLFSLPSRKLPQPDWQHLHDELARHKKLTLILLWQEYKEGEPSGCLQGLFDLVVYRHSHGRSLSLDVRLIGFFSRTAGADPFVHFVLFEHPATADTVTGHRPLLDPFIDRLVAYI